MFTDAVLLPVWCVVDFNAFAVGQAVLGLDDVIVINTLPATSVVQLPLVVSTIRQLRDWME